MKSNLKIKLFFEGIVTTFAMSLMISNIFVTIPYHFVFALILCFLSSFLVFYLEIDYFKNYVQIAKLNFTMDFLIGLAIHITYFYSLIMSIITIVKSSIFNLNMEFWEISYELSFFVGLGHFIENKVKRKSSLGIKNLLELQSKNVYVLQKSNDYVKTNIDEIKIGDVVKVLKGQAIPTDGILKSNNALLDYSSLLGESIPRELKKDDLLLSGSVNVGNYLIYKTTKSSKDSTLSRIIIQLENIILNKSKFERISQKIVKYFLPIVLFTFLFTFILWIVLGMLNIDFGYSPQNVDSNVFTNAFYHAVSTIVIACPCAFGIAAPAAIYSSSYIASKNKIIFASPKIYELANLIEYIAFDKTGTLTKGTPVVIDYKNQRWECEKYIKELSSLSQHPLSSAINNYFSIKKDFNLNSQLMDIEEQIGIGIFAKDSNHKYYLGSIKYAIENHYQIETDFLDTNKVKPSVVFAIDEIIVAYFVIEDVLKEDAKSTINKIKKLGIKTIILSGDQKEKVRKVAQETKVDYWFSDLLPEQKLKYVDEFKKQGKVIFVGDGINDVLAIKSATMGIAFASGSEITNLYADISLIDNDLKLVYKAIVLAKRTIFAIKLNFVWAALFNLIFIPLAILGFIPIWLGASLMVLSTTFLLANTILFQRKNKKLLDF